MNLLYKLLKNVNRNYSSAISMAKCNYGTRYIIVGYRVEISPFSVIIMCNVSDMVVALNGTAKVSFQSMQPTK